jgi:hypothetical protein
VFDITVFSVSIDIEMSAGAMDEQAIMLTAEEVTMQEMEDIIDCQEQLELGGSLDVGSNYMALAGISHEEMWGEAAASLGFVAAPVNAADEGSLYSPGMVDLLQSMGFIFMNEFSESEPSEIGDAAQVSEDFSEIEEAALNEVLEIGEVEGEGVQMDLQHDNWIRVPPQFNRRERGVAKEEMKDPFVPGAGYYSVLE